jgi:hypothetical protein
LDVLDVPVGVFRIEGAGEGPALAGFGFGFEEHIYDGSFAVEASGFDGGGSRCEFGDGLVGRAFQLLEQAGGEGGCGEVLDGLFVPGVPGIGEKGVGGTGAFNEACFGEGGFQRLDLLQAGEVLDIPWGEFGGLGLGREGWRGSAGLAGSSSRTRGRGRRRLRSALRAALSRVSVGSLNLVKRLTTMKTTRAMTRISIIFMGCWPSVG